MSNLTAVPARPNDINTSKVVTDRTKSYVVASPYSGAFTRILRATEDQVETEVSFKAYDKMEADSTIYKSKRIRVTSVLADDLQFAPGATAEQVGDSEFDKYRAIMDFSERVVKGLDKPIRDTLEQHYGNALKYGHGIAEIEWDYRLDSPIERKAKKVGLKQRTLSALNKFKLFFTAPAVESATDTERVPSLVGEKTRLMPTSLKVKPRDAARFVVDDFWNVLGLVPTNKSRVDLNWDEIVDREKFMILTLGKQNEDPRGTSNYRPAFNWYNLKTQMPAEMLRFVLEESVPKSVGTMAKDMPPFEFERDENGTIVYEDPDTKKIPKMLTGAESFRRQMEGFHSGMGAVIPFDCKLEPYKKGLTGTGDAEIFNKLIKIIDDQIEETFLLQTLAQSEGEHQARSASQQVAEILYNLVFLDRWSIAEMLWYDLIRTAVRVNFGDWAIKYMPMISLGDFVRRDWIEELLALAEAYFKGFVDDSQRPELMQWLNMPEPGRSRQELGMEAAAKSDVNGNPGQPNSNRPDKQAGTKDRNTGNGTEKKKKNVKNTGFRSGYGLGNNTRWFRGS